MKKIIVAIAILMSCGSFAQEQEQVDNSTKKNEIKLNTIATIAGFPEFSYERILNEESSVGVSLGFAADPDFENKFQLTPYYRIFFGKKPAAGFFIEGFGMLNSISIPENRYYYYDYNYNPIYTTIKAEKYTDFALGFGLGAKWMTKKGVIFELYSGIGRNLLSADLNQKYDKQIVGRGGLNVGYRF